MLDKILRDTSNTTAFVDFVNMRYCKCLASSLDDRKWLYENKFVDIDENIVYPIMQLNSNNCKTTYCCGGHIGLTDNMYIAFKEIDPCITERFNNTLHWKSNVNINTGDIIWRASTLTFDEWIASMQELYCITKDMSHNFDKWVKIQAIYKNGSNTNIFLKYSELNDRFNSLDPDVRSIVIDT